MLITRQSPLTQKFHTVDLDVTLEQLVEIKSADGRLIQHVLPHLTSDQREFILTGYTPQDWDTIFEDE